MIKALKDSCISVEKAKSLDPAELQGKVVVGEFVNSDGKGGEA
jgi:hypothetical protein